MTTDAEIEVLLRQLTPQVLGALVRRYGHFDACEDSVQEALLAAVRQWPADGVPDNPKGWLLTVASRRLTDQLRAEESRRRREVTVAAMSSSTETELPAPGDHVSLDRDDTLKVLFLCCHPALSASSQLALTLRAVGGLTTAQIARAFLVPEATMAQRVSRAKQRIKSAGATFSLPAGEEWSPRLGVVLHVLYLIFNEGYTSTSGPDLHRAELTTEAIRLTRQVRGQLPDDGEVAGLLALMLLTDARRAARTTADGALVPLTEQDRGRWDTAMIEEGVALVSDALANTAVGPYQVQAAIAAVHGEARTAEETDWRQILALYDVLTGLTPGPMVSLNRAVAAAMVHGPETGLQLLDELADDPALAEHHRLDAVRAHLLELSGDLTAARESYRTAARRTTSVPEQQYLEGKAATLTDNPK